MKSRLPAFLVLVSVALGFGMASAAVVSNPVGEAVPGGLNIGDESFAGFRFSVGNTFHVTGVSAILSGSDGSNLVAVLFEVGPSGFPAVAALNPSHPDVAAFAIHDMGTITVPTMVEIPFSATLEAGEYVLMFVSMAFGDEHTLQAYQAATGSDGVVFEQDLDGSGFIIPGTLSWSPSALQPDIRIEGTLVPEPSVIWLGGFTAAFAMARRSRR